MYLRCVVVECWILLCTLLLITKYVYIYVKTLKTFKKVYVLMLCLVSDIIPIFMLYSWRNFGLLCPVSSGWISVMTVKAY